MNKKFNSIFLFIFLILISLNFSSVVVQALPLATAEQQLTTGYAIKYPAIQLLKFNQTQEFNFHVFNISDGLPIQNAQCFFHLYNSSGEHILTLSDTTLNNQFDYVFLVLGGNFSVGTYSYVAQCNNSAANLGGFVSVPLEVTDTGTPNEFNSFIIFIIFLLLAIGLLIIGITQQNTLFTFFSGLMVAVAGIYLFANPTQYLSSLLNSVLCYILWGVGGYLLLMSGIRSVQEGV